MKVTPQQLSPAPGYPAHRRLTPLRAAVIAALACSVTACHDSKPEPAPEVSQPVKQEKKAIRLRPAQKQTQQTPLPVFPTTSTPSTFPVPPGGIPVELEGVLRGDIAVEPLFHGETTPLPAPPQGDRGTIIEINPDTPTNEP